MAFPGQKIKTSLLKRYLLHGKQYVSGHAAGTRGFHAQALEVQISWRISNNGRNIGVIYLLFISYLQRSMSSNQCTLNSDVPFPVL